MWGQAVLVTCLHSERSEESTNARRDRARSAAIPGGRSAGILAGSALRTIFAIALLAFAATPLFATVTINNDQPLFTDTIPFLISGTTDAQAGSTVKISVENKGDGQTQVQPGGTWQLMWTGPLPTGTYSITATIVSASSFPATCSASSRSSRR